MTKLEVEQKLTELRKAYDKLRKAGKEVEMKNIETEGKMYKGLLKTFDKPCARCHKKPRINLYHCEPCEVRV